MFGKITAEVASVFRQNIMKKIVVTQQEIWDATKPKIEKNKKKYTRKGKVKTKPAEKDLEE